MQFEKIPEMQVLKALCVQKRATPRKGSSLVYGYDGFWNIMNDYSLLIVGDCG